MGSTVRVLRVHYCEPLLYILKIHIYLLLILFSNKQLALGPTANMSQRSEPGPARGSWKSSN
jgi:hypothetical protein